jgi:cyclase
VANGRTVKGVKFQNLRDIGDPVELAAEYERQGADELVFLDISASVEGRKTMVKVAESVADVLSIPFTVGGGISSLSDVIALLDAGADKVSINTAAVANNQLVSDIAQHCGSQCCVLAIDARRSQTAAPNGGDGPHWEVLIKGGREQTGLDALEWAARCVALGAGEILLTSWDKDGTLDGFDIELVKTFSTNLPVPIIASGGARDSNSFAEVFANGFADAALAATIFHEGRFTVREIKSDLSQLGVQVRLC